MMKRSNLSRDILIQITAKKSEDKRVQDMGRKLILMDKEWWEAHHTAAQHSKKRGSPRDSKVESFLQEVKNRHFPGELWWWFNDGHYYEPRVPQADPAMGDFMEDRSSWAWKRTAEAMQAAYREDPDSQATAEQRDAMRQALYLRFVREYSEEVGLSGPEEDSL
jgi:hypothetical protein